MFGPWLDEGTRLVETGWVTSRVADEVVFSRAETDVTFRPAEFSFTCEVGPGQSCPNFQWEQIPESQRRFVRECLLKLGERPRVLRTTESCRGCDKGTLHVHLYDSRLARIASACALCNEPGFETILASARAAQAVELHPTLTWIFPRG